MRSYVPGPDICGAAKRMAIRPGVNTTEQRAWEGADFVFNEHLDLQ